MLSIELIQDPDCPHVPIAKGQLLLAFFKLGIMPTWQNWNRQDPESPPYALQYPSPTILINGHPIAPEQDSHGEIPSLEEIVTILMKEDLYLLQPACGDRPWQPGRLASPN